MARHAPAQGTNTFTRNAALAAQALLGLTMLVLGATSLYLTQMVKVVPFSVSVYMDQTRSHWLIGILCVPAGLTLLIRSLRKNP